MYRLQKEIQTLKTPQIAVILSLIYVLTPIFTPAKVLCSLVARSLIFSPFCQFGQFLERVSDYDLNKVIVIILLDNRK